MEGGGAEAGRTGRCGSALYWLTGPVAASATSLVASEAAQAQKLLAAPPASGLLCSHRALEKAGF